MSPRMSATLIRDARKDAGMTQAQVAAASGVHQPTLSAYESGRRHPNGETLRRILAAVEVRPSIPLALFAGTIVDLAHAHKLGNVRVFGSVLTGDDTAESDIDLLVDADPGASLFDIAGFVDEVEMLTGFPVDIMTTEQARTPHFAHVLDQAVLL